MIYYDLSSQEEFPYGKELDSSLLQNDCVMCTDVPWEDDVMFPA